VHNLQGAVESYSFMLLQGQRMVGPLKLNVGANAIVAQVRLGL
jgi:hypothetical protein